MTLHETTELAKKMGIGAGLGIVIIVVLVLIFQGGVFVKNVLFPRAVQPPNVAYDKLPPMQFPENAVSENFTYTLNTETGALPTDFPNRLVVFPVVQPEPNLLNLEKAKQKAVELGFVSRGGNVLPETQIDETQYEWTDGSVLNRTFIIDIITFDFLLTSNFTSSIQVLEAQNISNEESAFNTATEFLTSILLFPNDLDLTKTSDQNQKTNYTTYPQLYSIQNGELVPTTSLSRVQAIRVDLYQKDIEYELKTGVVDDQNVSRTAPQKLPILYPRPPYSTMNFWIASGDSQPEVMEATFVHQEIDLTPETEAIYPIKSVAKAFEELKEGNAYIAAYSGSETQILINNVFLAYYIGDIRQQYLMPIIVFEGDNGFFGYVSAVDQSWIQ